MGCPDRLWGDLLMIPKPLGRFGGCPVSTGLRHACLRLLAQIADQTYQPLRQAVISQVRVSDFVLGPGLHLLASFLCAFSFPLSFSFSFVLVNLWVMIRGAGVVWRRVGTLASPVLVLA